MAQNNLKLSTISGAEGEDRALQSYCFNHVYFISTIGRAGLEDWLENESRQSFARVTTLSTGGADVTSSCYATWFTRPSHFKYGIKCWWFEPFHWFEYIQLSNSIGMYTSAKIWHPDESAPCFHLPSDGRLIVRNGRIQSINPQSVFRFRFIYSIYYGLNGSICSFY